MEAEVRSEITPMVLLRTNHGIEIPWKAGEMGNPQRVGSIKVPRFFGMSKISLLRFLVLINSQLSDDAWQFLPEDLLFSHLHFNLRPREPPMFPPAAQAA
uniref:Transposase n=1 Tax=Haemonchus contortus TaxID=6289 RepID=A0A7I4XU53_HAECO